MRYSEISRTYRNLLIFTATMTYFLVILGGIVCMTESSRGCPDWPGCYGEILPPARTDAIIEFAHRISAALTGLMVLISAIVGVWKYRKIRWLSRPPMIAVVLLVVVSMFGATAVLRGLSPPLAAVDLGLALLVLALMITAAVVAMTRFQHQNLRDRLSFQKPFARLSLSTLFLVFIVLVSGDIVANGGSIVRCLGWPLISNEYFADSTPAWHLRIRDALAMIATIMIFVLYIKARRAKESNPSIRRVTLVAACAVLLEIVTGLFVVSSGNAIGFLLLYVIAAVILWTAIVATSVLVGIDEIRRAPTN